MVAAACQRDASPSRADSLREATQHAPATSRGNDSSPAQPARPGIRFNAVSARPGLTVGTLVLDTIEAQLAAVDSVWVGMARFRGELTLTGQTMRHFEPDARAVCFEADSASAARMPRWDGDNRRAWFCFENVEHASQVLAAPGVERKATLVVDRFVIHRGLSDQVNSARLVRVVNRIE